MFRIWLSIILIISLVLLSTCSPKTVQHTPPKSAPYILQLDEDIRNRVVELCIRFLETEIEGKGLTDEEWQKKINGKEWEKTIKQTMLLLTWCDNEGKSIPVLIRAY